jgi:Lrp/AsnC family transcriptional regulator, regulator for asnA, asnC and gidA
MIINILREDSSMPFVEIAKKIGISDGTVPIRIRKLIDSGIISKFTICVDNNLVGYRILSFLGINVEPGFVDKTTNQLSGLNEVLEIHEMHGKFDLLLKIRARDLNEMRAHIKRTELMTALKTRNEEQTLFLKEDNAANL